jgi:two-component system alkaline phosphatase synthesis response regulator PhoP
MTSHILFVGKSDSRLQVTWTRLESQGYEVHSARSRKPALEIVADCVPDIVIVDMTVPRTGAERLCRTLRGQQPDVPVLMLLDPEQEPPHFPHHKTLGRSASYRRMSSAITRLITQHRDTPLVVGSLRFDPRSAVVEHAEGRAHLCPKEAQLLTTFMKHPGKVLRHSYLMKAVWDTDFIGDLGTLWTHVSALREKIEPYPGRRIYLHTIRGVGYRLDVWPPPAES